MEDENLEQNYDINYEDHNPYERKSFDINYGGHLLTSELNENKKF